MTRVILLHGLLGAPDAWDPIVEELAARGLRELDLVAPWLPGHGPDVSRDVPFDFESAIDEFAASLGAAPAVWVGYSMGGRVALGIAARHPERVRGLVLVSSHLGLTDADARVKRAREDAAFAALASDGIEALVDAHERRPVLASQGSLPPCLRDRLRARRLAHRPERIAQAVLGLGLGQMPDLRHALRAAPFPVHAVAGGADPVYVALAEEIVALTGGDRSVAPGAGHDVVLGDPEAVADAVARTIARATGATRDLGRVTESHP